MAVSAQPAPQSLSGQTRQGDLGGSEEKQNERDREREDPRSPAEDQPEKPLSGAAHSNLAGDPGRASAGAFSPSLGLGTARKSVTITAAAITL